MRRSVRVGGMALVWIVLLAVVCWSVLAVYYGDLPQAWRGFAAAGAGCLLLGALLLRPWKRRLPAFSAIFGLLLVWWFALEPSNARDWQPDVVILPSAEIEGDRITLRNISNCEYTSETEYTVAHYDKTPSLRGVFDAAIHLRVLWV